MQLDKICFKNYNAVNKKIFVFRFLRWKKKNKKEVNMENLDKQYTT